MTHRVIGGAASGVDLTELPVSELSEQGLQVQDYSSRMLRDSRSRPVVSYDLTYIDGSGNARVRRTLIGKGYFRDDGAGTYDFMRQLWSDGFADDPSLTIPEPVAYLPERSLLIQGHAPGRSLYEYIDNPADAEQQVRMTARWLAKLHSSSVSVRTRVNLDFEREKIGTYKNALMEVCPRYAARIERLTDRTLDLFGALDPNFLVPTHGDFQPKNIHIQDKRVTVIDFDRFALANPARDLGHFAGQCITMSYVRTGSFEDIKPWNGAFLSEYSRRSPEEALRAVPAYIARTFLEILYYKLVVKPVKDPYFVSAWLDECERWLESPVSG